jgi:hypothetical protein
MSIMSRIGHFFGMNTASLEFVFPDELPRSGGEARGSLSITARSEQVLKSARVSLVETLLYAGAGPGKPLTFEMGSVALVTEPVRLAAGEVRVLEFVLPYKTRNAANEAVSDEDGYQQDRPQPGSGSGTAVQAIATVDLKGVSIDPLKSKNVRLV